MSSGRRSPPQDGGKHKSGNVEPFYTNEDVAVLHNIVVLAQEILPALPERERLPTNALFNAYYDVLPRIGVNADHDSRYARVLFKIGGLRSEGTLYDKFEEILSRMGITVEFDGEEQDAHSEHDSQDAVLLDTEAVVIPQSENVPLQFKARRNSDSAWDLGSETPASFRQRRNSYSSQIKAKPDHTQDRKRFVREILQQYSPGQLPNEDLDSSGSNVGAWLNAKQAPSRKERGRSISTQPGMRIRRRSPSVATGRPAPTATTSNPTSDECHAESEITAVTSVHEADITGSSDLPQEQISVKSSAGLLQIKAEVILQHNLNLIAKSQLRTWRDKAFQQREHNAVLNFQAFRHDKGALLKQALDCWYNRYLEKRSVAETERFFTHLEQRSVQARNLYLLNKAFTYWYDRACEAAERTQAARRHILRTRIFNAWRDITAVNELKVRRQVLKKFFALWHTKFVVVRGINTAGLRKFEGNLVEKIFRQWLRKIWDTKANTWWAEGLKQRVLSRWNFAARSVLNNHRIAKEEWYLQLEWNSFRIWRAKLDTWVGQERRAVTFRRMNLCYNATKKWRYETKVMPAKKSLQTEVATRILRDTFEIWLHRSRQESKATAIDRMRILREAWTNWRHKSRSRIIRSHVDNRLIQDTFHNWLVAKRIICTERRSRQDLLRETIQKWAKRAQESNHHNLNQEDLAHQFAVQKIQTCVMRRWSAHSQFQRQFDVYARDFYASRLLRGVFLNWQGRVQHLQKLRQWSRDTEFYFLTSKTLKHWKASMVASRREKRKVAYAQVRRSSKMNLSSGVLLRWRSKAQKILDMQSQAREVARNKSMITGMNIFDRWRARTEELGEMDSICRERVLKKFFETWKIRSRAFRDLEVEAMISFDERQQAQAIKKWKLLVLQFRGRYIQATEVQDKNAKKSFRKMFKYWHQKAAERRPANTAAVAGVGEVAQLGGTARAETWSDFGDEVAGDWAKGLEEAVSSTPLPGYLSTPSRRTERVVAAAARFSSTTPRAPMSTPFERHLRAQYSGGMSSFLRQAPGRSTLGMGGGFPDITDRRTGDGLENP